MTDPKLPGKSNGDCAVDIRIFVVTVVFSTLGAFLAGFSIVPPKSLVDSFAIMKASKPKQLPRSLELSKANLYTSLEHSPSGQHLLVDIEGIEADFLDSEERLADAMVQTVEGAGLTMLSYHCHQLEPAGISCVGVLLESHISFHTWPEEGVITLDLFTCGANPLLPVVPLIERLFGVGANTRAKWSHELRGFRSAEEKKKNYLDNLSDLSTWILSPLEVHSKKMIYSNLTRYQRVDIWDLVEPEDFPSYMDGLNHNLSDGDKRWWDPELVTPDRILFLDGSMQSMYSSDVTYHEAMVHPPMFAHPSPERVGIIGGGEGAILREVLKHKTLKHVTMIEIDEDLIQIAREYLPKMSDCSSSTGRAKNCFDDSIVDVVNDNGLKWFVDRYGLNPTEKAPETQFDVILVDALDPEDDVPFNTDLYVDTDFVNSIMDSLSEEGVILIQIGTAPELLEPRGDLGVHRMREKLLSMFENHPSVAAMHVYEEAQSGFLDPHSFLMICKNTSCRNRWYARSDEIDYEIHDRVLRTESGEVSLKHYDGATQNTYQVPPKAWETVYCRREPTPFECNYIYLDHSKDIHELYLNDGEKSSFSLELEKNELGEIIGASLKTKVDIKEGSYIMPQHLASPLVLTEKSLESIRGTASLGAQAYAELYKFADENARLDQVQGTKSLNVEIGASVFIRSVEKADDANVDHWMPTHPTDRPKYSPVYDRHHLSFNVFLIATQDIPAGTELTRLRSRGSSKSDEFVV